MSHTAIPHAELDVFTHLPDVNVIVDVGAREDVDYLDIVPDAQLHSFEPNPEFFKGLVEKINGRPNVYANNYGLGDAEDMMGYNFGRQSFVNGEIRETLLSDLTLPIKTLDWYVTEHNLSRIDFLKIDTEGYDFRVLMGATKTLGITRFIQYEHWDDKEEFHYLLEKSFDMEYIGYRNVLCMNKRLVHWKTRKNLSDYIAERGYKFLV